MATAEALLLDTSVLLGFFIELPRGARAKARALRRSWLLNEGPQLLLLDLSIYELVNVLVRQQAMPGGVVARAVQETYALEMPVLAVDAELAARTAMLAEELGISGYDAAFVAASRRIGATLVTADEQLEGRVPDGEVALIGDLEL